MIHSSSAFPNHTTNFVMITAATISIRIHHITPFVTHIKFTTAGIIHPVATMSTPVYMEFSEKFSELTWLVAR